ncbi:MAG: NAD(+)/NADH kinase [Planctomycetota bacterium]|jgi:NAD+ kinase|nr:NAD(+)/NADH kinase [Planctomycetota bacterium]
MRILLVTKQAAIERYDSDELVRLAASSAGRLASMERGARCHAESLALVREQFDHDDCTLVQIDELDGVSEDDFDLVVTVGGDGTVLAAHSLLTNTPVLAVNSDPERSLGHFTRCQARDATALLQRWRDDAHSIDTVFRLQIRIGDAAPRAILNECLFTNCNPALMSRYRIQIGDHEENQYSSGMWLSTPAGSTGAIASAGMAPCPDCGDALLYKVREPFQRRGSYQLLQDVLRPPQPVHLMPTTTGMTCYLDGAHRHALTTPVGTGVVIEACEHPLHLLR